MAAKIADEVCASLSSLMDAIPKDVFAEEGIVFKEEPLGEEEEYGGKSDGGKSDVRPGGRWAMSD